MIYYPHNQDVYPHFPMKKMGWTTGFGFDWVCADVYVSGNHVFPTESNAYDSTLVGSYHERFFNASYPNISDLPAIMRTNNPGSGAGLYSYYNVYNFGFGTAGSQSDPNFQSPSGFNLLFPFYANGRPTDKHLWADSTYAYWHQQGQYLVDCHSTYYDLCEATPMSASNKMAGDWLTWNSGMVGSFYVKARPYAVILFRDWSVSDAYDWLNQQLGSTANGDGFGFNFNFMGVVNPPADWDSTALWTAKFTRNNMLQDKGIAGYGRVIYEYTYDGHSYVVGAVSTSSKFAVKNGQFYSTGRVSTPLVNADYINSTVNWNTMGCAPIYAYILELGCEYYREARS